MNNFEDEYGQYMSALYRFGYLARLISYMRSKRLLDESEIDQIEIGARNCQRDIKRDKQFRQWDFDPDLHSFVRRHGLTVLNQSDFYKIAEPRVRGKQ